MLKPIDWARQYAATMDDAPSLRTMRRLAKEDIARNANIRALIVADPNGGEDMAAAEWDPTVAQENAENQEAIDLIEARMKELGIER